MEQRFTFDQAASPLQFQILPPTHRDEIVSIVALRPEDAILDVGCGTGQATRRFAPLGYRIVALDPGAQMIEIARESLKEFANIEYVVSTFEAWPARSVGVRARNASSGAPCSYSPPVRPCQGSGPGSRPAATSASRPK